MESRLECSFVDWKYKSRVKDVSFRHCSLTKAPEAVKCTRVQSSRAQWPGSHDIYETEGNINNVKYEIKSRKTAGLTSCDQTKGQKRRQQIRGGG